jgi:hypothetical protein
MKTTRSTREQERLRKREEARLADLKKKGRYVSCLTVALEVGEEFDRAVHAFVVERKHDMESSGKLTPEEERWLDEIDASSTALLYALHKFAEE